MRRDPRHPTRIPFHFEFEAEGTWSRAAPSEVGRGGLSFRTQERIQPGTRLRVRISDLPSPFTGAGTVTWCRSRGRAHEIGVRFDEPHGKFVARMVDQVSRIDDYRRRVRDRDGRHLTGAEAAAEWVEMHAAGLPGRPSSGPSGTMPVVTSDNQGAS